MHIFQILFGQLTSPHLFEYLTMFRLIYSSDYQDVKSLKVVKNIVTKLHIIMANRTKEQINVDGNSFKYTNKFSKQKLEF